MDRGTVDPAVVSSYLGRVLSRFVRGRDGEVKSGRTPDPYPDYCRSEHVGS